MAVPDRFVVEGQASDRSGTCRACSLPYSSHSGRRCSICMDAVEHHAGDAFDDCLAGRRRTAEARRLAGIELTKVDREALREAV